MNSHNKTDGELAFAIFKFRSEFRSGRSFSPADHTLHVCLLQVLQTYARKVH